MVAPCMVWSAGAGARKDQIMVLPALLPRCSEAEACYTCALVTGVQSRGMLQLWMLWSVRAKVRVRFPWLQFVALLHCRAHVTDLWIRGMLEAALWISSVAQGDLCSRAFASSIKRSVCCLWNFHPQVISWEKGDTCYKEGNDDKDTDCNMEVKERVEF